MQDKDLIFTLCYTCYTREERGFRPDVLFVVFALMYEDGGRMCEVVVSLYAGLVQQLCLAKAPSHACRCSP